MRRLLIPSTTVFLFLALTATVATGQTLAVNNLVPPDLVTVTPGSTVTVHLTGGPGNARDWVALYRLDSPFFISWQYLNGSHTPPCAVNICGGDYTTATVNFIVPNTVALYNVRLMVNDSSTVIATSSTIMATNSPPPTITVNGIAPPSPVVVPPGKPVTVTFANGLGGQFDWIGLYAAGASNQQYISPGGFWALNGATSTTWTVTMPDTVGAYEFRYFWNSLYAPVLATSTSVPVQLISTVAVNQIPAPATMFGQPSTTVTVDVANGPGRTQDWVGLYTVGAANTAYLAFQYLTNGAESGSLTFTLPANSGDYEFRFFGHNTYTVLLATSATVASRTLGPDQVQYYDTDAIGSVRLVTNNSGQTVRHDYSPFGEESDPPASTELVRFVGKEWDQESSFDYFGARYTAAGSGRFTSVDPALDAQVASIDPARWNRYAYAGNNPLRFVDPDGADFVDFVNGVVDSLRANAAFGLGRLSGNGDFQRGQTVGDLVSLAAGVAQTVVGAGATTGGTALCATGVGCLSGAPLAATGATAAVHGVGMAAAASAHLMSSTNSDEGGRSTAGNMQKQVERGQAPKSVDRVDHARYPNERPSVAFKDGNDLYWDGKWKHGGRKLTNAEMQWLLENGWSLPK